MWLWLEFYCHHSVVKQRKIIKHEKGHDRSESIARTSKYNVHWLNITRKETKKKEHWTLCAKIILSGIWIAENYTENTENKLISQNTDHAIRQTCHVREMGGKILAERKPKGLVTQSIFMGLFRIHLSLHFKAWLSAKSFLWKSVFILIEIGSNYHNKNFALRLGLKERLRGTQKWPIALMNDFT